MKTVEELCDEFYTKHEQSKKLRFMLLSDPDYIEAIHETEFAYFEYRTAYDKSHLND
jgi:hypothetical protein